MDFNNNTKITVGNSQLRLEKKGRAILDLVCLLRDGEFLARFLSPWSLAEENLLPELPNDLLRCKSFPLHPRFLILNFSPDSNSRSGPISRRQITILLNPYSDFFLDFIINNL
jgi:hypothetical protein